MKHFTLPKDGGLIETSLPKGVLHSFEKINTEICIDSFVAANAVADNIVNAIIRFETEFPGKKFKLGFSSGESVSLIYPVLSERCKEGKISFKNVEIYSMDEYYPLASASGQSRNKKLKELLINNIDIPSENVHIIDGSIPENKISDYCALFDKSVRNLDLFVGGMGTEGQLGFNYSGVVENSRTRTVLLPYKERKTQSKKFNSDINKTPKTVVTLGISTVLSAKRIILVAWGEEKAKAVKAVAEGEITSACPASYLQKHENIVLYVDDTASELLTRIESPWMVGPCEWSKKFVRKAVIWLCRKVGKPVLKLTQKDYLENSLGELLEIYGPYDKINIDVFNDLQHTITGWPGGKPNADDVHRPVKSSPFPKRVIIFSPHPDDDVISMGGTFIRLVEQGHDVHVAYQVSGDVAVHDDVVLQHIDAAYQLGFGDRREEVKALVKSKKPGCAEPKELLHIKAAIRRSEARGAVRSFGLDDETNSHFLNLPFYESGGIAKLPRSQADVDIIKKLIKEIRPDQIYMAGDLADPHGTHRVCTEATLEAIDQLKEEGESWLENTTVWLYRGAWMEWELGRVDMAVPLSPDELIKKRHAIFRHLSQKDIVPFPGDDPREFWQRAEERTQNTAILYNELGMAEYQAIEVFLKLY